MRLQFLVVLLATALSQSDAQMGLENSVLATISSSEIRNPLFVALSCNAGVRLKKRQLWSSVYSNITEGDDVEIPCGQMIVLDEKARVPRLRNLIIRGALAIPSRLPSRTVEVQNILVTGFLNIGLRRAHLQNRFTFKLVEGDRRQLEFWRDGQQLNFGYKAVAVVGGQVRIFGMPGGTDCLTSGWVRLAAPARKGDRQIQVDSDVETCWRKGYEIGLAQSYGFREREQHRIIRVEGTKLTLSAPLRFDHFGSADTFAAGGQTLSYTTEVALLTRNAVFDGVTESGVGTHFIVAHTALPQKIYGAEFVRGGQPGVLGRYPLHFHLCEKNRDSFVVGCSIHNSRQRGLIIHGTDNVVVSQNVAFGVVGHIYGTEDGIETNNTFNNNLAIGGGRASTLIVMDGEAETDNQPACFWMTAPGNILVDNVASGCIFGFWFDLRRAVRGPSANLPWAVGVNPQTVAVTKFHKNIAHTGGTGLSMYPHGMIPKRTNEFLNFFTYFNSERGIFTHNSMNFVINDSVIADCAGVAVDLDRVKDAVFANSLVIGRSPLALHCPNESGIEMHPVRGLSNTRNPTLLQNIVFDMFEGCPHAPLTIGNELAVTQGAVNRQQSLPASNTLRNLTFADDPDQKMFVPETPGDIEGSLPSQWMSHAAIQLFSSPGLGADGFLLSANNDALLPPDGDCESQNSSNLILCRGVCYRTVEFKITTSKPSPETENGAWRLKVTRLSDDVEDILDIPAIGQNMPFRQTLFFFTNLLADQKYLVEAIRPEGAEVLTWQVRYDDGLNMICSGTVELILRESEGNLEIAVGGQTAIEEPCTGSVEPYPSDEILISKQCRDGPVTSIKLPALSLERSGAYLILQNVAGDRRSCESETTSICGIVPRRSPWSYYDQGRDPGEFQLVDFNHSNWNIGTGIFGYNLERFSDYIPIGQDLNRSHTAAYFRTVFNVSRAECFAANKALPHVLYDDGFIMYLNGKEILRKNMAQGAPEYSSLATANATTRGYYPFETTSPIQELVDGSNVLAVEVHRIEGPNRPATNVDLRFDMFLNLAYQPDCI